MRFSLDCNRCGKCCTTGPALSVPEAIRFRKTFIVGLRYQIQIVYKRDGQNVVAGGERPTFLSRDETATLRDYLTNVAPVYRTNEADFFLEIFPCSAGYSSVHASGCEALGADGGCTLHPDKPAMCRVAPMNPLAPPFLQPAKIRLFKEFDCAREGEDANPASLIFEDGTVVSHEYESAWREVLAAWGADAEYAVQLAGLVVRGSRDAPPLQTLIDAAKAGGYYETSMAPWLIAVAEDNRRYRPVVKAFIEDQRALIEAEIARALARKDRAERVKTDTLRNFLATYEVVAARLAEFA